MADDPVTGMKRAVDAHFDAAVGSHVRAVTGAAREIGGRVVDGYDRVKKYFSSREPSRRTTDIRLPTERRQTRRRR